MVRDIVYEYFQERYLLDSEQELNKFLVQNTKRIKLNDNNFVTTSVVEKVYSACNLLETIHFQYLKGIETKAYVEFFRSCSNLKHIAIDYCENITDEVIVITYTLKL